MVRPEPVTGGPLATSAARPSGIGGLQPPDDVGIEAPRLDAGGGRIEGGIGGPAAEAAVERLAFRIEILQVAARAEQPAGDAAHAGLLHQAQQPRLPAPSAPAHPA